MKIDGQKKNKRDELIITTIIKIKATKKSSRHTHTNTIEKGRNYSMSEIEKCTLI